MFARRQELVRCIPVIYSRTREDNGRLMGDLVTVNRIASMLEAITSDGDLKAVTREVHKRACRLQALRAAGFHQGDRVSWRTKGKTIYGLVERIDGCNVMVKLDHGFVARIPPRELSLSAREKRLSA
jgi:hypothetical protein